MGCFMVPAAEAVITTVVTKTMESKEKAPETMEIQLDGTNYETVEKITFSRKLKWLNNLLWGGSALLAFEHVWHGEVIAHFPFLSAAANPTDLAEMLHEMTTTGVAMSVLVTVVWLGMVAASSVIEKKALKEQAAKN
ncbi:MAG: hypothetical protein J1D87_04240 [Lachnospiraceae bacterium]|nr:hypothetical protein [Lachnospiraceae bacterium]